MPKNWGVLLSGDPCALGPSRLPPGHQPRAPGAPFSFLSAFLTPFCRFIYSPPFPISLAAPLLMFLILTTFSKTEVPNLWAMDQYFLSDQR